MDRGSRPEPCDDDPTAGARYLNRVPACLPPRAARRLHCVTDDGAGTPVEPALHARATRVESMRAAVSGPSADQALRSIVEMALDSGVCDAAGLMAMNVTEDAHSACASSRTVGRLDALQLTLHQGPAVDSLRSRGRLAVVSGDLAVDGRWKRWRPAAIAAGFASVIALRLFTDRTLGALNLYSVRRQMDNDDALAEADAVAAQASVVLAYTSSEQRLWQAIEQQNMVGQAQGILMQRYGVTAAGAGAVLRRYAEYQDVNVADLARRITNTRRGTRIPGEPAAKRAWPVETFPFLMSERRDEMTFLGNEPVGSGQQYPVTDVDGRTPSSLTSFTGDVCLTLIRNGSAVQMLGSGCAIAGGRIRFHQKDPGADGKDVRVWTITEDADGTFVAAPFAAF